MKRLALIAALALLSAPALAAPPPNELPSIPATNGVVRTTPSAIIIPEDPDNPGGSGCVVGSTGCDLPTSGGGGGGGRAQPFAETTIPLGISGQFIGATARDAGSGVSPWAGYAATFIPDKDGTASILCSNDAFATTYTCATAAVAAGVALTLRYPVTFRYFKPKLVNGATAQTSLVVTSAFLAGD